MASRRQRPLDDPAVVARLLDNLREAGGHDQAAVLAGRQPAADMFGLFLEQEGLATFSWTGRPGLNMPGPIPPGAETEEMT